MAEDALLAARIADAGDHALIESAALRTTRATIGFSMTLSEACQNIVEHAQRGGWVAVHYAPVEPVTTLALDATPEARMPSPTPSSVPYFHAVSRWR